MNRYEELRKIIVEKAGVPETTEFSAMGYKMTVRDYMQAITEHGGADVVLMILKNTHIKDDLRCFLQEAITGIIKEYKNNEPSYLNYYKNVLRKVV